MARMLIDRDPLTGEAVWYEYRAVDDTAVITHTQDIEPIIERNIARANDDSKTDYGIKNDVWKYAEIPNIVYTQWLQKYGVDVYKKEHHKLLFKLLNDPEYKYLKTTRKYHDVR